MYFIHAMYMCILFVLGKHVHFKCIDCGQACVNC